MVGKNDFDLLVLKRGIDTSPIFFLNCTQILREYSSVGLFLYEGSYTGMGHIRRAGSEDILQNEASVSNQDGFC